MIEIITAIGSVGTLVGAWLVYRTLQANHDWQRRQYAIDIVRDWNKNTNGHSFAIEDAFPGIRDIDKTTGKVNEISKERAKKIYVSNPTTDKADFELRFHIIQLLNYLEYVVTAYNSKVADEAVIVEAMKNPIVRWVIILNNFLDVVEMCEGYQPWGPLRATVKDWEHELVVRRQLTA
jgi:hypothetical protein